MEKFIYTLKNFGVIGFKISKNKIEFSFKEFQCTFSKDPKKEYFSFSAYKGKEFICSRGSCYSYILSEELRCLDNREEQEDEENEDDFLYSDKDFEEFFI